MNFRRYISPPLTLHCLVDPGPVPEEPTQRKAAETMQQRIDKQIAIAMAGKITRGMTVSEGELMDVFISYDPTTDTFDSIRWPVFP